MTDILAKIFLKLRGQGLLLSTIHHFLMKTPTNWAQYILENENQAISQIYTEHRSSFIGWVKNSSNCSEDTALDIFQVSIVILFENVVSGKLRELDNVKSYLFKIGKNKLMEHYRSVKQSQHQEINESVLLDKAIENEYDNSEEINKMFKSLTEIGDPCKSLLENFYFKKMTLDEIAIQMNYKNRDTVKTKKFKCIQRLRKLYS